MTQISERTMLAFRDELQKLAAPPAALGAVGRFFGRQLHSLTGWKPSGGLEALRPASYGAMEDLRNAVSAAKAAPAGSPAFLKAQRAIHSAGQSHNALQTAEGMGLTSLPGVAGAVRQHGLLSVLRTGAAAQWHGTHPGMKALMVGLPAAGLAQAALSRPQEGKSKAEGVGQEVGSLIGGIAGAPMPIVGSAVLGEGLGQAGKYVGRGVGKFRSMLNPAHGLHPNGPFPRQSTDLTQESGQATPSEHIMTARASGGGGGFE